MPVLKRARASRISVTVMRAADAPPADQRARCVSRPVSSLWATHGAGNAASSGGSSSSSGRCRSSGGGGASFAACYEVVHVLSHTAVNCVALVRARRDGVLYVAKESCDAHELHMLDALSDFTYIVRPHAAFTSHATHASDDCQTPLSLSMSLSQSPPPASLLSLASSSSSYAGGGGGGGRYSTTTLVLPWAGAPLASMADFHFAVTPAHVRRWMRELLTALAHCHARGVIHRDVKPANMTVTGDARHRLQLIDFDTSCRTTATATAGRHARGKCNGGGEHHSPDMTTLWYRAPEILHTHTRYGARCDVWSAGCVMLFMLNGGAHVLCHETPEAMVRELDALFGRPPCFAANPPGPPDVQHDVDSGNATFAQHDDDANATFSQRYRASLFAQADIDGGGGAVHAYALCRALLQCDPAARPSAADALAHAYFATPAPQPPPPPAAAAVFEVAIHTLQQQQKQLERQRRADISLACTETGAHVF
jgi:serine/threonine protein kinase